MKNKFFILMAVLCYKICFEIVVAKYYESTLSLFKGLDISIEKLILSYFTVIMVYFILSKSEKKISDVYIFLLYLLILIPSSSYYYLTNDSTFFYILICMSILIISFFSRLKLKFSFLKYSIKLKRFSIRKRKIAKIIVIMSIFLLLFLLMINIRYPTFKVFNFKNIYILRGDVIFNKYVGDLEIILREILTLIFVSGYILPRGISYIFFIIMFMIDPQKSFLILPIFVIGIVYLFKIRKSILYISLAMAFLNSSALIFGDYFYRNIYTIFIRRALLVPAQLNFIYYDFIASGKGEFIYYFKRTIEKLLGYQISNFVGTYSTYIGEIYFSSGTNANNGYVASEYIRSGVIGVIMVSIFIGILFNYLEVLGKKISKNILNTLFIMVVTYLITTSFWGALERFTLIKLIICTIFYMKKGERT